jgi:hypothetical protein
MDFYAMQHIKDRMELRGFKVYHTMTVPLITQANVNEYRVPAYNEFFYLVSRDIANGTIIHSDIEIYDVDQYYAQQVLSQIREFSGLIIIENPVNTIQFLEFIRVIPE